MRREAIKQIKPISARLLERNVASPFIRLATIAIAQHYHHQHHCYYLNINIIYSHIFSFIYLFLLSSKDSSFIHMTPLSLLVTSMPETFNVQLIKKEVNREFSGGANEIQKRGYFGLLGA